MFLQKWILTQLTEHWKELIHHSIRFTASTVVLYMEQWGFLVKCCIEVVFSRSWRSGSLYYVQNNSCQWRDETFQNWSNGFYSLDLVFVLVSFSSENSILVSFFHLYCVATICFDMCPHIFSFQKSSFLYQIFIRSLGFKKVNIPSNFIVS